MKRFFKYLLILILLLVVAGIVLPWVFQDEITRAAKEEINSSVNAEVDFSDASLSWFSSFPALRFQVQDFTVHGTGHFKGVRLARVGTFALSLDLWSVLQGSHFTIQSITIRDADVHVLINEQGEANYDIVKETTDTTAAADTGTSTFKMALQRYQIRDLNLIYEDREGEIYTEMQGLQHQGNGDFTAAEFDLSTHTEIAQLTVGYEGVHYLEQVKAQADMDFRYYTAGTRIVFQDNKIRLNDLALQFEGEVAMPSEDIIMDLRFDSPTNRFKSALSLIPSLYARDFATLKSSGQFTLQGRVNGTYGSNPERYPAFDLTMEARNGTFSYPDLPTALEDFSMLLKVKNPTAQLEGTEIDLRKFHFKAGSSELTGHAHLQQLMSDPHFDIGLTGQMNLADLNQLMPNPDYQYAGAIQAQLLSQGSLSSLEAEAYQEVKVEGGLQVDSVLLQNQDWPYPVKIPTAEMQFTPQRFLLSRFVMQLGQSDLSANGELLNMLSYALSDELLTGRFALQSHFLDLTVLSQWSGEADTTATQAPDTGALEIIRLPENVQFVLDAQVDSLRYGNMPIQNLRGTLNVVEGAAQMKNLRMQSLGGEWALSGAYDSKPETPVVDLNVKASDLDFYRSYRHLTVVKKLLPIMNHVQGNYSLGMGFQSKLNPDMTPDMATVSGEGELQTSPITVGGEVLNRLSAVLNNPALANQNLKPLQAQFSIKNGRLEVEPFAIQAGRLEGTVQGQSFLNGQIDYTMQLQIPVGFINAQNLLSGLNLSNNSGKLPLNVKVGGTMKDPKLQTDFGNLAKNALESVKEAATQGVQDKVKEARAGAEEKARALIEEAEKKGEALIAQAQQKADQLETAARQKAQQLRTEADKQAQKLLQEAGNNPLKKVAAQKAAEKIRSEADQRANQLVKAAQEKGDQLVAEARQQKQKLIDEAEKKADKIAD